MTTQQHSAGIAVADSDWIRGGSQKDAYISPWYVTTIKYSDLDRHQGTLANDITARAVEELHRHTAPSEG